MKEDQKPKKASKKEVYEPPQVKATVMNLEYSIAASSALVSTPSATDQVLDEWNTGIDRDTNTSWN